MGLKQPGATLFFRGGVGLVSTTLNYWTDKKCAKAFWGQQELPAYRSLLRDTVDWADPNPGEEWLDLGCGGGSISRALWERSAGSVASILGVDCAATNEERYAELRKTLTPAPGQRVRFQCHSFSEGLSPLADAAFDNVVSGLSISYAESTDPATGAWNTAAYDRLLGEVCRVLRPGGRFVFSVNVPEPSWWKVGLRSLGGVFRSRAPLRYLRNSVRMMRYGAWLKQEARTGRFHYLPQETITDKLEAAGFTRIEQRLTYVGQAYLFRACKPRLGEKIDAR